MRGDRTDLQPNMENYSPWEHFYTAVESMHKYFRELAASKGQEYEEESAESAMKGAATAAKERERERAMEEAGLAKAT